jgi:hypothetical protein
VFAGVIRSEVVGDPELRGKTIRPLASKPLRCLLLAPMRLLTQGRWEIADTRAYVDPDRDLLRRMGARLGERFAVGKHWRQVLARDDVAATGIAREQTQKFAALCSYKFLMLLSCCRPHSFLASSLSF